MAENFFSDILKFIKIYSFTDSFKKKTEQTREQQKKSPTPG